jgi:hypothetical protein
VLPNPTDANLKISDGDRTGRTTPACAIQGRAAGSGSPTASQTEGLGSVPAVKITGTDNSIYRPYCAIGGDNATHIIRVELGAARNHIYDAFGSTGAFTFTNLIYSVGEARGTGSEQYHIPEWFDQAAVQKPRRPEVDSAYSASINFDLNLADKFYIGVTNTSAFTINAPASVVKGYRIMFNIKNISGGAMGTITWDAVFKLAGAFVNPANTKQRNIEFYYDGINWIETNRAAADI